MANKRATSSTECKCNRVTRKKGSKTYWARGCACMFKGGRIIDIRIKPAD